MLLSDEWLAAFLAAGAMYLLCAFVVGLAVGWAVCSWSWLWLLSRRR